MMYFEIEEDKVETLSENLENGLRYIGKAMQCIDEMRSRGGERSGMRRSGYGMRDDMDQQGQMGNRGGGYGMRMGRRMSRRDGMTYRHGDMNDDYDPMSDY